MNAIASYVILHHNENEYYSIHVRDLLIELIQYSIFNLHRIYMYVYYYIMYILLQIEATFFLFSNCWDTDYKFIWRVFFKKNLRLYYQLNCSFFNICVHKHNIYVYIVIARLSRDRLYSVVITLRPTKLDEHKLLL